MKTNNDNFKLHYKMYKSGKKWLISGVVTSALIITVFDLNSINQVSADEQVKAQNFPSVSSNAYVNNQSLSSDSNLLSSSSVSSDGVSQASSLSASDILEDKSSNSIVNSSQDTKIKSSDDNSNSLDVESTYNSVEQPTFKSLIYNDLKLVNDNELTKQSFLYNNSIYSEDKNSINTTDGFLTANTWYRPKKFLKDGTTWTSTNDNDFRPLLMVWWPNKQIKMVDCNFDSNT